MQIYGVRSVLARAPTILSATLTVSGLVSLCPSTLTVHINPPLTKQGAYDQGRDTHLPCIFPLERFPDSIRLTCFRNDADYKFGYFVWCCLPLV